jgi:hypothetical protein
MSLFTTLITSKIAAGALAAGALAVGGTAAAAYSGSLPGSLQQGAHSAAGTPAPSGSSTEAPSPKAKPSRTAGASGPDATGPAAFGLCTAYAHGGLHPSSTAYTSLESAAKGTANIGDYCAKVTAAHESANKKPDDNPEPSARAHGKDEASESPTEPPHTSAGTSHRPENPGRP